MKVLLAASWLPVLSNPSYSLCNNPMLLAPAASLVLIVLAAVIFLAAKFPFAKKKRILNKISAGLGALALLSIIIHLIFPPSC